MSYAQRAAMERSNYYSDSRVIESMSTRAYTIKTTDAAVTVIVPHECLREKSEDDDTETLDDQYVVRTVYCVCDMCAGSGNVVNPSIDAGGISSESFAEDPEFAEAYFSGKYDITCPQCAGKRVALDMEAALRGLPPEVLATLLEFQGELDYDLAEQLAELRMGC